MDDSFAWKDLCPGRILSYWLLDTNGFSNSRKYRVVTAEGSWFLKQERGDRTKRYTMLTALLEDKCFARPVCMRYNAAIDSTAYCTQWVDGVSLTKILRTASSKVLIEIMGTIGELIYRLHQIGCPDAGLADNIRTEWQAHRGWLFEQDIEQAKHVVHFADNHVALWNSDNLCLTHQDCRSDNIMVQRNGQLVLIDFSAASFSNPYSDFVDLLIWEERIDYSQEERFLQKALGRKPVNTDYQSIGLYGCAKLLRYVPLDTLSMPSRSEMLYRTHRWLDRHWLL